MNLLQAERLRDIIAFLEEIGMTVDITEFVDYEDHVKIKMEIQINKELKK